MNTGRDGWGPFLGGLDDAELKARTRTLRLAVMLAAGDRAKAAAFALLRSEIGAGDPELLAEAEAEFMRMAPLDKRAAWSIYRKTA